MARFVPLPRRPVPDDETMCLEARRFYEHMAVRRTVRHYSSRPVPREVIEWCLRTAGTAPSGANMQPWHFVAVSDPSTKRKIRLAAEEEEKAFYASKASEEWLKALEPLGTDPNKPFLETAPWLIAVFARKYGLDEQGRKIKHYYTPESVGLACGMLITALHTCGLATLTHTPSPMGFLREILGRPDNERPFMLLVVGHPAEDATVPDIGKKDLSEIATFIAPPAG